MADPSLNQPVIVRAVSLNASSIPISYSPAYTQYILSQAIDFTNVAGKANEAGQGAYDAQVKNDEQDVILSDHEQRLDAAEETLADHELRITQNTNDIEAIKDDYVSKSATDNQTVQPVSGSLLIGDIPTPTADKLQVVGSENVSVSYKVAGLQVVGARQTGWTAATGTALLGAFDANQAFTVSNPPTQAEVQAIANALVAARQRIKALEDAQRTHGQIN
ncbi:phage tail protein [Kluyvera ascorbata]|uniref:phage tail protein n=1 Tax=Kluyvera ascorbata TaxID=51288 RepID=UPI003510A5BF